MTRPIEALFAALPCVKPYPERVVATDRRISGVAFFPGGAGLWVPSSTSTPSMPVNGVMVLGQDFHTHAGFRKSVGDGGEVTFDRADRPSSTSATWTTLIKLLPSLGIPLERCFFTNAYMGLRVDGSATGRFSGSRDLGFTERCRVFFQRQLEAQRPRLILSLGAWVPRFVAPLSPSLSDWRSIRSLSRLDELGPVRHRVAFAGTPVEAASVVCLTHPSLRGPNVGRRRYRGLAADAAERAMVAEAIDTSGIDLRVVSNDR